jgi:opacity protein-like surface antigen
MRNRPRATISLIAMLSTGFAVPALSADPPADNPDPDALQRRLEQTEQRLRELAQRVAAEQQQLDADRRALEAYRRGSDSELSQAVGKGAAQGAGQPTPVGEAPSQPDAPAATAQIFEEPTALTPRGKLVLEPDVQYVHSTNNQVALVGYTVLPALTIGLIDVQRIESNLTDYSLTARYGLTSRWELEVKAPYITANTTTETRPLATASETNSYFDSSGSGLGDVEVAMRTQLNHFHGDNAVWIASLRYKTHTGTNVFEEPIDPNTGLQTRLATGSGFDAVQPGVTVLFPSDPAVFFGGVAYTYSFAREVGHGYGRVDPGGILDLTMGMGLALNEHASFSVGYQHSVVDQTTQPTPAVGLALTRVGTLQLGTLRFGVSYRLTERFSVNTTIGIGVTRDTPDLEATLRLPYRF